MPRGRWGGAPRGDQPARCRPHGCYGRGDVCAPGGPRGARGFDAPAVRQSCIGLSGRPIPQRSKSARGSVGRVGRSGAFAGDGSTGLDGGFAAGSLATGSPPSDSCALSSSQTSLKSPGPPQISKKSELQTSKSLEKKTSIFCNSKINFNTNKNYLYRVIFNLVENASKFGKSINIKVKKKLKLLTIEIEDDGPGIPDYDKNNIFKPFYKIDSSRNINKGGSGLGLSIANELIKKLHGEIKLRDSKTKGSIFSIILTEI